VDEDDQSELAALRPEEIQPRIIHPQESARAVRMTIPRSFQIRTRGCLILAARSSSRTSSSKEGRLLDAVEILLRKLGDIDEAAGIFLLELDPSPAGCHPSAPASRLTAMSMPAWSITSIWARTAFRVTGYPSGDGRYMIRYGGLVRRTVGLLRRGSGIAKEHSRPGRRQDRSISAWFVSLTEASSPRKNLEEW